MRGSLFVRTLLAGFVVAAGSASVAIASEVRQALGKFSDEYDLVIEKAGAFHNASWITDGKVSAGGVGMEVEKGLAIGWRRVADWSKCETCRS